MADGHSTDVPIGCFHAFLAAYEALFQSRYGFLRPIIPEVVGKFLDCGDLERGFARVRRTHRHGAARRSVRSGVVDLTGPTKAFEYSWANQLWMTDGMHGPSVPLQPGATCLRTECDQAMNMLKMRIVSHKSGAGFEGAGGNPDVIRRNRSFLPGELAYEEFVSLRHVRSNGNGFDSRQRQKLAELPPICLSPRPHLEPGMQLA